MPGTPAPSGGTTGRVWQPGNWPPEAFDARLQLLQERMAALGHPVRLVSKVRSADQQRRLFAQGRSTPGNIITEKSGEPGDESRHQLGAAADFGFRGPENWALLGQTAKELGLEWGGDWKTLVDKPHVQMPNRAKFVKGSQVPGAALVPGSARVLAATTPPPAPPPAVLAASAASPEPEPSMTVVHGRQAPPDVNLPVTPPEPTMFVAKSGKPDTNLPRPEPEQTLFIAKGSKPDTNLSLPSAAPAPMPPPMPPPAQAAAPKPTPPVTQPVTPPTPAAEAGPAYTPADIEALVREIAKRESVDPDFAAAVAEQESHFQTGLVSPAGARGVMQLMPETAKRRAVAHVDDPVENIIAGVRELRDLELEHKGDLKKVLRRYNASPRANDEVTDWYVQEVFKNYRKRAGLPAPKPGEDTDGRVPRGPNEQRADQMSPSGPLAGGWIGAVHSLAGRDSGAVTPSSIGRWGLHKILGLDPLNPEDRANIGGTTGGMAGSAIGSVFGPPGTYAGGIIGSVVGGGAGQLYNELFGPPPRPEDAGLSPTARVATAGGEQGLFEATGQALAAPFRSAGKAAIEDTVARAAKDKLAAARRTTMADLYAKIDALRTSMRDRGVAQLGEKVDLARQNAAAIKGARQAGAAVVDPLVADQAAKDAALQQARETASTTLRDTTRAGQAGVRAAQTAAKDRLQTATAAGESLQAQTAAGLGQHVGQPSVRIPVGEQVAATMDGPVQRLVDSFGQAVRHAAESPDAPLVDITGLKARAQELIERDMMPQARTFPTERPLGDPQLRSGGANVTPAPPEAAPEIEQIVRDVMGTQFAERQKDPVVGLAARIMQAPDHVPLGHLHALKSESQDILKAAGVYDRGAQTLAQGRMQHLTAEMRRALAGANHAPYEQATREYATMQRLLERGYSDDIIKAAQVEPARIARMIRPDDPSRAAALVELLTSRAEQGGGRAGGAQGAKALQSLQHTWVNENLYGGGFDEMVEALAKLDKEPEFVRAFLGDKEGQRILGNARQISELVQRFAADAAKGEAAAKLGGERAVTRAGALSRKGVVAAEQAGEAATKTAAAEAKAADAAVEQARKTAQEKVTGVRERVVTSKQDLALEQARKNAAGQADMQGLQVAKRKAAEPTPDEVAFAASSLNRLGDKGRSLFMRAARATLLGALGYKGLGMVGSAGALLMAEKGVGRASERDLLRWIAASDKRTQFLVKHIFASYKPGAVASTAIRAGVSAAEIEPHKILRPTLREKQNETKVDLYSKDQPRSQVEPPPRPPKR